MTPRRNTISSAAAACLAAAPLCSLGVTAADLRPQWLRQTHDLAEIEDSTRSRIRTTRIALYLLEHGAQVPDDLAELAWHIGLGASIQMRLRGPADPLTRRLHGALRSVHAMALADCRWDAALAEAIEQAIAASADLIAAHPQLAIGMRCEADWIGHRIQTRTTEPGDIAGAELYRST
jgi:hypothetical protein